MLGKFEFRVETDHLEIFIRENKYLAIKYTAPRIKVIGGIDFSVISD